MGSMVSLMIGPPRQAKPGVSGQPRIHRYSDTPMAADKVMYRGHFAGKEDGCGDLKASLKAPQPTGCEKRF